MRCNLCNAIYAVQSMWCNVCDATYVMQSMRCNLYGAMYAMQPMSCNLCGATHVVQCPRCNLCGATDCQSPLLCASHARANIPPTHPQLGWQNSCELRTCEPHPAQWRAGPDGAGQILPAGPAMVDTMWTTATTTVAATAMMMYDV